MKPLVILSIVALGLLLLVGIDEATASSLTASLALFSIPSGAAVLEIKLGCKLVDGQPICGKQKSSKTGDDNDNGSHKKKKNKETGSQGERSCGPSYVVLKEKNKYGSFCEATEAVKPNCAPGTVLNDEQCNCPAGTVPKNGINNVQSVNECQTPTSATTVFTCEAVGSTGLLESETAPTEKLARAFLPYNAKRMHNAVITGPITCRRSG